MEIVRRVARDTIPSVRREVLVAVTAGPMTVREVCVITRLGDWEARRKLEDLHVLDVLSVKEEGQIRFYDVKEGFHLFGSIKTDPSPALETAPDGIPFLRHIPGNEMHPKLTGAKNLMALSDRIKNDLRWNREKPDSWIARDAILAFQLPEDSAPDVEAFVASMRKGMDQ
jgi:hypothetical protein